MVDLARHLGHPQDDSGRLEPPRRVLTLAERVSERSRRRKLALFLAELRPSAATTILDVGVDDGGYGDPGFGPQNYFVEHYPWRERITAVSVHPGERFRARYPEVRYVQADGCDLPFRDEEFDVYHSNAVVEHVGDEERQRRFAREAVRVARSVFLTTPNRRFPLELHTRAPLVHWLPERVSGPVYEAIRKPWARELRLLGPRDLHGLFAPELPVEVVNLGMTLVAIVRR